MKKIFFLALFIATTTTFVSAQAVKPMTAQPVAIVPQFTKAELLAFTDLKAILSSINKGKDYSNYVVRNFTLNTIITNPDKSTTKLSESGPGGKWSQKQINMIEKYAKKEVAFTLEDIMLFQPVEKGVTKIEQPNTSFTVKE